MLRGGAADAAPRFPGFLVLFIVLVTSSFERLLVPLLQRFRSERNAGFEQQRNKAAKEKPETKWQQGVTGQTGNGLLPKQVMPVSLTRRADHKSLTPQFPFVASRLCCSIPSDSGQSRLLRALDSLLSRCRPALGRAIVVVNT